MPRISTLSEPAGRIDNAPARLIENEGIAFIGSYPLGMGFVLEPDEAQAWIAEDKRNSEVLFPFLNGEDLNSRADCSASRWVIDFADRTEAIAATYAAPFTAVKLRVKPERDLNSHASLRRLWWQFKRPAPAMRRAISRQEETLVITLHARTVMPMRVQTGQVFSHALGVFATDSFADQAVLSSSLHQIWAIKYGSGIRTDPRYTPSDVFETFPRPQSTDSLTEAGRILDTERREIMLRRDLGLTKLYNLVNDPQLAGPDDRDVARLRQLHVELDEAVTAAYGWSDVSLEHGFHTYRQMKRWTLSPAARVEILDRLLAENLRRAAAQSKVAKKTAGRRKPVVDDAQGTLL